MKKANHKISDHEKFLIAARKALTPSPVKLGKVPTWLKKSMKLVFKDPDKEIHSPIWSDHWGTAEWGSHKDAFVSEPYGIGIDTLVAVDDFAKKVGCEWKLCSNSYHFPGNTFRIVFYPKG